MLCQEFYETNIERGFLRGYDLQISSGASTPISTALGGLLGNFVAWGEEHHQKFKDRFQHMAGITIMTEELPEEQRMFNMIKHLSG